MSGYAHVRNGSRLCKNVMLLAGELDMVTLGSSSGADRLHQTTNAQNADCPFHVVGQDV
jgi:hypothetical protein